ncbi:hypothetical protein Dda_7091 [Drechslerella dactyloides]|uniref:Uncharacterized protein n=1 Tax=Drechslerella dactyloides TaxID=74499 RepID=A0AAD6NIQ7_DREDA|nr:hypothetical protein Dda_7091 [Drechslerella dactyloides]
MVRDAASDEIAIDTPISTVASATMKLGLQTLNVSNLQTGNHITKRTLSAEPANPSKLGSTTEVINPNIKTPDALKYPITEATMKQRKTPRKMSSLVRAMTGQNNDPPLSKYRNSSFQFKKTGSDGFSTERSSSRATSHISRQKETVAKRKSKRESARHYQAQVSFFEDEENENVTS